MDYKEKIISYLHEIGITGKQDAAIKSIQYLELLYGENKNINLVGTREKDLVLTRHFLDSLSILKYREEFFSGASLIADIGSGGGLPGLLLSVFMPDKNFYLVEKSLKKADFLNRAIKILGLDNATVYRGRAEQLARDNKHRERYDLVLARAVTSFGILAELIIPFCKISGKIIFYKSRKVFEEIEKYNDFIKTLGGKILGLHEVSVPGLDEFRAFLEIEKERAAPLRYPRNFSKIKRDPAK
ncbi:MAG: 16S rRNA (guanine(527)-N(7))-methyltransferase RsmG [Actinomycetota bacterium]